MPTIVSRNTIKLANAASSVNGYYVGYKIILNRFDATTGKQLVQKKDIIDYEGATRVATISGIWDADFIPAVGDTYDIVPRYPDSRISINFAIQTLDYITSTRYGKGLDPFKDLYLPSWLESARLCDVQSDVTIKTPTAFAALAVGDVYSFTSGTLKWQGEVKSFETGYVRFTNCLGKLANKWNSWKSYAVGTLVYEDDRLYITTGSGTILTRPVHTSGTSGGLTAYTSAPVITKISGTGPSTISLVFDGNPVRALNSKGQVISGYSLYDSDGIDYWRYLGWDGHEQRYVTRHQGNLSIDTSVPISENLNNMLQHFGGILRYSAGKYHLDVEVSEPAILNNDVRNLTLDDIVGKIQVSDEGIRKAFNSLTVAYADPANKFEGRNISFFNSEFLKTDRNVPKKGNVSIPGITNYYNARMLADKFLVKSRYGLTINLNVAPKGLLLLAGSVIQIQHAKYGWVDKKFRIINLTHNENATVDIVAEEYDDKFYLISNIRRSPATAPAGEATTSTDIIPGGLYATSMASEDETVGGIELTWNNSPQADSTVSTELFGSLNANLFITATSINGSSEFIAATAHNLTVGDSIIAQAGINGLEFGKTYYVKEVISTTIFTLSETPGGAKELFVIGSGLSLKFITASIITIVSPPTNSFIDVIPGQGASRIQKYYWIRHRITKQ